MKTNEFLSDRTKRKIISEVLSGKITKEQARRIYRIKSKSGILEWMRIFAGVDPKSPGLNPIPFLKDMTNHTDEVEELKQQIKQLKEDLKFSQLKGKAYQIMVEIAKQDYGLDLEKKPGAKQSKNSKK